MPSNKYALIRYRIIDRNISNKYRPYPSINDLMEACSDVLGVSVSKSTIEKDIKAMKTDDSLGFNAPIAFSKSHHGYYYKDPDYSIRDIPLNDEEVDAIQFAAQTLFQFKNIPIFKQYESAIDKILDRVLVKSDENDVNKSIQFENLPTVRGNEFLQTLLGAIQNKKTVEFNYQSFKKQDAKRRKVNPYLLKEYRHRWYLIGFSLEKQKMIVFGLDRISDLSVLVDSFEVDTRFQSDLFFKYSIGITTGNEQPQQIEIEVNNVLKKYLISQPLHHSQQLISETEDKAIFTYQLCITYELKERLLGFGSEVRILSPDVLKTEIVNSLKKTLANYQ